jgi:phage regulator Rha-like protein
MVAKPTASRSTAMEPIEPLIQEIRGQKVIVDVDLANIYGVETRVLNQAVRRNVEKFPSDFLFRLTPAEVRRVNRSQTVIGPQKHRNPRYRPFAFTEHGAIMAANILNSPRAVQMSVYVVRAFIAMRRTLSATREQTRKLSALEKELKERLDVHEAAIVTILQRVMDIIDPPAPPESSEPPRKEIGFKTRERRPRYGRYATADSDS